MIPIVLDMILGSAKLNVATFLDMTRQQQLRYGGIIETCAHGIRIDLDQATFDQDQYAARKAVHRDATIGRPRWIVSIFKTCQNSCEPAFTVAHRGRHHVVDSFEGAIHVPAPHRGHCGCRINGHGVRHADELYCSARRGGVAWKDPSTAIRRNRAGAEPT